MHRLFNKKWIKLAAQLALAAAIIYFMAGYLQEQWDQIKDERLTVHPLMLFLAQIGFIIGMGIQPLGTWIAIRGLDGKLSRVEVWQAFFTGQVAKYLPGSLWSLPSRGFLYNQRGMPAKGSIEVVLWETGLAVVAATLLFIISLPLLWGYQYLPLIVLEIGGFSLAFMGAAILLRFEGLRGLFGRIRLLQKLLDIFPHLPIKAMVQALALYLLMWVIIGSSFMGIVYALDDNITLGEFGQAVGLFPGVWAVGLLIFITPGGIGIREALLTVALGSIVDDPTPLFAAVIARITWTIAEVVGITGSTLVYNQNLRTKSALELEQLAQD